MCTLTIVPGADFRVRLAFNRDERPTRTPALPPEQRRFGCREAILPIDPESGGTWLAVNDAGLALAVLNVNLEGSTPVRQFARSRGAIIPTLLECDSPSIALTALEKVLDYRDFAPFRLVLIGHGVVADVRWDGREPMVTSRLLGGSPLLFTSSGLGDQLVQGVRSELFAAMFGGPTETWESAQEAFHRHRWPGREHLSVNMIRATARTVSFSRIDLNPREAIFLYHPGTPDAAGDESIHRLPILTPGAA